MIGLRELAILAAVVLVLYGRSGVLKSRQFQSIWPWISPQRRASKTIGAVRAAATVANPKSTITSGRPRLARRARPFLLEGNRLFWFLTILAATAVAAIIVGRIMVASGTGPGLSH
jgi:hypothetical protein